MPTQITADLPTLNFPREVDYPTQEDWAAFSAAAEENFRILGGDWSTQMQLWKTEANLMSTELNTNASIAQGLADYQGDWVSQGYTLGQTVSIGKIYYICKLTHIAGQNPTDISSLYWNLAFGNWNLKVNTDMSMYSSKTTPTDADLIPLSDSTSSFGIKKISWANLKANFDNLYIKLLGNQTISDIKTFTSSPIAPTLTAQDNSNKVATTAYVDGKMVLATAINSTSGTAIDFTGIPTWAKKITILFNNVKLSGSSNIIVQIGNGTIVNTGYISSASRVSTTASAVTSTLGFIVGLNASGGSEFFNGIMNINKVSASTNLWTEVNSGGQASAAAFLGGGTSPALGGTLDRVRITTVNGTDTFANGSINIMYEG